MPTQLNGLPAHVLLVHVLIALVPLAGITLTASAVWPAARRRLGVLTPALALAALIFVPITTKAGQWLRDHLGFSSKAIRKHTELGNGLLPWAVGIFLMAAAVWVLARRFELSWRSRPPAAPAEDADSAAGGSGGVATATRTQPVANQRALPVWVTALVAALSVVVAVGGIIQLYRIGDSGAQAVWHGVAKAGG